MLGEAVEVKEKSKEDDKAVLIRKKAADTAKKLLSNSNSVSCTSKNSFLAKKSQDEDEVSSNISSDSIENAETPHPFQDEKNAKRDSGLASSTSSSTISSPDTSLVKKTKEEATKLSRNAIQIEAILKKIHEDNKKTRDFLQIMQEDNKTNQGENKNGKQTISQTLMTRRKRSYVVWKVEMAESQQR